MHVFLTRIYLLLFLATIGTLTEISAEAKTISIIATSHTRSLKKISHQKKRQKTARNRSTQTHSTYIMPKNSARVELPLPAPRSTPEPVQSLTPSPVQSLSPMPIRSLAPAPVQSLTPHSVSATLTHPSTNRQPAQQLITTKRRPKRLFLSPGVGVTFHQYTTRGIQPLNQTALTVKAALDYILVPKKWNLVATASYTGLQIGSNYSVTLRGTPYETASFNILRGNLDLAYTFPNRSINPNSGNTWGLSPAWRFSLMGGVFYSTTFIKSDLFGYRHIGGPQLFPFIRRIFPSKAVFSTYVRYSPVVSGFKFTLFSNHEIAAGVSYRLPPRFPRSKTSPNITLDFTQLSLSNEIDSAESRSVTLGVAWVF